MFENLADSLPDCYIEVSSPFQSGSMKNGGKSSKPNLCQHRLLQTTHFGISTVYATRQVPVKRGLSPLSLQKKTWLLALISGKDSNNPFSTGKFLRISHRPEYSIRSIIPWSW